MDAKTAASLERFKNLIADAAYEEYMLSGAGLRMTRSKQGKKAGVLRRRCNSTYQSRGKIILCHLKEGHSGNHQWFSWFWFLPKSCRYAWSS